MQDHLLQQIARRRLAKGRKREDTFFHDKKRKGTLPRMYDTEQAQEPSWPSASQEQMLELFEESHKDLAPVFQRRRGRKPKVTWHHLCLAILTCFLRGWNVQLHVWRALISERLGPYEPVKVSDQAVYTRLHQAEIPMQWLFDHVTAWVRERFPDHENRFLAPFATEVLATDASTLDRLGRFLPWLRTLPTSEYAGLGGQIHALFDVRRQQWVRVLFWRDAAINCKEHFQVLVEHVASGALLLMDRGYLSFELYDSLTERQIWWVTRYAHEVSYMVSHVCYVGDGVQDLVVYLGKYRSDQARYPVRLITFWMHGRHYRYLTNVLDPHLLPLADVARLYARRWDIELAFRMLKEHLNLHHLWSCKESVLRVQLWCCLILAQLYHALQVEIAQQNGVEVFDVSLDLLVRLTPGWLAQGQKPLQQARVVGRLIGLIRPSTRLKVEVPWIDPLWVTSPPGEAIQPRAKARRSSHRKKDQRSKEEKEKERALKAAAKQQAKEERQQQREARQLKAAAKQQAKEERQQQREARQLKAAAKQQAKEEKRQEENHKKLAIRKAEKKAADLSEKVGN
jgi:hypothetical protein